jgi:hypothetical protein
VRAWISYTGGAVALLAGLSVVVGWLVGPNRAGGVWLSAAVAGAVQVVAFAMLVSSRRRGRDFMVSWASGMVLRFAAIAGLAFWVTRRTSLDAAVTLLSLVGFVFVLVLLEPLFLRLVEAGGARVQTEGPRGTTED